MYRACAKVLRFTITNKHGRSTEANVMSSTAFCRRILSALRKKDGESGTKTQNRRDLYVVEIVQMDTTLKQPKFISWDSVTNTMSGVITIVKGITFPSCAWKKCFSPRKVRWRIEATFTGNCIVASFLRYLLNYVYKSRFSGLFFGL